MFVLCPHCHFLVGMDPRTGGPPAACPKCGGTVVEPVAATTPDAAPLDPFAPAALPSVAPTLPAVEAEPDEAPAPKPAESPAPPSTPKRVDDATDASSASAKDTPAPLDSAKADAGTLPAPATAPPDKPPAAGDAPARPSADEMIAALATRPARKPRAPRTRTKKPAAAPASTPAGDADTPRPVAPPAPSPAPSAAATFGARLRRLFARAPRQADTAESVDAAPAVATDVPPAAVADATPATPALSIRNRRRRAAAKAPDAPEVVAPEVVAAASAAGATSAATPASSVADSTEAPAGAAPIPDAVSRNDVPPAEATAPEFGQPLEETVGIDAVVAAAPPVDAAVAPPENIDAAAAALVAAMPAQAAAEEPVPAPARAAPSFARTQAATGTRRDYRAVAAVAALAGLLGLQLLLAQRAVLAADPGWRPTVAAVCAVLRCELPPWREPAAFTMLSRHVRPHPDAPGTLLIDASFRNDARWPQPWPRLELTLADVDGRTVGARTFEAREYLGTPPTQSELAPGQAASLSLAVVEPAPDIVSFTFDFR